MRKKVLVIVFLFIQFVCFTGCDNEFVEEEESENITSTHVEYTSENKEPSEMKEHEYSSIDMLQEIVNISNKDEQIDVIYSFIEGEWLLSNYVNLAWYSTGEDNDEELRIEYEKKYVDYIGDKLEFDKNNTSILYNADSVYIYEDEIDYLYRYSVNKQLEAPILEVFCTYQNENVRFIIDFTGAVYFEYKGYFYEIDKQDK